MQTLSDRATRSGRRDAEHRQHEATDRGGREHAVADEVVECLVSRDSLVHPVRLDEVPERLQVESLFPYHRRELAHHFVLRSASRGPFQVSLEPVQLRQAVTVGFVAEVVGETGEAVDRHEGLARLARQQA